MARLVAPLGDDGQDTDGVSRREPLSSPGSEPSVRAGQAVLLMLHYAEPVGAAMAQVLKPGCADQ